MKKCNYNELMELTKDYQNVFDSLYKLKTFDNAEIDKIYDDIKKNLIETKILNPEQIASKISNIAQYNNRYFKSYWTIFKKLFEEYRIKKAPDITSVFDYFVFKEYGIVLDQKNQYFFQFYDPIAISIDVHEKNSIFMAIMNDDMKSFIGFTEKEGFDEKILFNTHFYPNELQSLLEFCCYYGAVNCFKFLITKFDSKITFSCLRFSFLSGNADIMNECLKQIEPDRECMKYAIISHNIDFVTFLMNEYHIKIYLYECYSYNNLQAFFVYLDQTNDIDLCLVYSPFFNIPSLCEYLISHEADINASNEFGQTALCSAAWIDSKEIVEILINHGANIESRNEFERTALHVAANRNCYDAADVLISSGADINAKDKKYNTPLNLATISGYKETSTLLIFYGANVNAKDNDKKTPLHWAAYNNLADIAELLISHGASINAKDRDGLTPLHLASHYKCKETAKILLSHGANVHALDGKKRKPIYFAYNNNDKEMIHLLSSHEA
ncbi:hypothetical protein TVAG_283780 [Trichomonas vaginalis G3]|uniref:DUF3447 domain-containing protein n=1 Tax=Trichomonas vaginalis (strain ATCC PRA-98 / G3) TaxID=412133 RepID=A2DET2_TRIV3|nr:spectrin binding [Trichomonas vaginalis G3]EAY21209.1 hypothetical protein TVAG_283780 [Trichomonas vaginalis G3]KAI5522262.1 spectrin binding [Trichomonas vaginalis G3]|eukprot:XP_001582195.1 hypothetical protein [Trichomonas vaginalis G3]